MNFARKTVLSAVVFLALGAATASTALATPNFYGVVSIRNAASRPVKVQYGWDGYSWHVIVLQPNEQHWFSWEYSHPDQNRSPRFLIGVFPVHGEGVPYQINATARPHKGYYQPREALIKEYYGKVYVEGPTVRYGH